MIRLIFMLTALLQISSCASKYTFQSFYNEEKKDADFALAFPKYMAMIAIPKESKEEVRFFTEGMKRIRVLYNEHEDHKLLSSFQEFAREKEYVPYIVIKQDGSKINLFTREDDHHIKEIIIDVTSSEETVIVALMGKMKKSAFQQAMQKASNQN